MPWNSQPGGGNGQGPWSRGPAGGGSPLDFDELLRRGQDRLRRLLPNGRLSRGRLALIGAGLLGVWLLSGIYFVTGREQGFVMRFGQVVAHSAPGINYHLPWPIERHQIVEVGTQNELRVGYEQSADATDATQAGDIPNESYMLTRDGNVADINFTVLWVVNDASAYLFNVDHPDNKAENTIKAVAESAMREVIGETNFDSIKTSGAAIESHVREKMQTALDLYGAGITVNGISLGEPSVPARVNDAVRAVQAARADQENMRTDAENYASRIIPEARGNAESIVQQADAYRQKVVAEATGKAKQFLFVYQEYKKAPEVTRRQIYLETMSQILAPMNKVIIDESAGRSVTPYLALPELQKRNSEAASGAPSHQGSQSVPQLIQGPQP